MTKLYDELAEEGFFLIYLFCVRLKRPAYIFASHDARKGSCN